MDQILHLLHEDETWVLVGLISAYWVGTYAVLRVNKPTYETNV